MSEVILSFLKHKNKEQIKISFEYNFELKEYVKKFPLVKWSKTHKTFYLPFSKENTNNFYLYLKDNNCKVDYNNLVKNVTTDNKKTVKPLKTKFEPFILKFEKWLTQMRYSSNTIKTYVSMIKLFFRFYPDKTIADITRDDIEGFNNDYILKNNYSATFQNQLINAIKLFYTYNTNTKLDLSNLDRPKKENKLPVVLSINEVKLILSSIKNLKHQTLLSLLYSCGLRIGEAINLKINSIDFERNLLHVKSAKGRKDRFLPISPVMISMLKKYLTKYNSKLYVFEGQNKPQYSAISARKVLKRVLLQTSIKKNVTLHTLRHSYATHLLENGTDIRFIQELLGHNSPKTTMIYTHVSTASLEKIKNPFDSFNI